MKKQILFASLVMLTGMALTGCGASGDGPISQIASNKIATQSMSALSLVNSTSTTGALKRALLGHSAAVLTDDEIKDIKDVLGQVDTILANNTGVTSVDKASDDPLYEFCSDVTYTDIYNNSSTYTLYFNSVTQEDVDLDEKGENASHQHGEHDGEGHKDDGNEVKTITNLEGILVSGEETYNFTSMIKEEIEEGEQETKVHFKLFNDSGFYVKAMQESEIENGEVESKIRYTVFDGTSVVTSYCLKVEQEVGEDAEIKLQMNNQTFRIKQIFENEIEYLKVRYTSDGVEAKLLFQKVITVDDVTGESTIDFVIVE